MTQPDQQQQTPPAPDAPTFTQAEVDRLIGERLARAKPSDYDDLKSKAKRLDELEAATASDLEKAVRTARSEARTEALREATPRVVRAEFRAAAKGVLTREQTEALLEDLDLSKYVTDSGDVDEDRVNKKVQAFAPAKPDEDAKRRFPDLGQGPRGEQKPTAGDFGRQMAERRFGTKK